MPPSAPKPGAVARATRRGLIVDLGAVAPAVARRARAHFRLLKVTLGKHQEWREATERRGGLLYAFPRFARAWLAAPANGVVSAVDVSAFSAPPAPLAGDPLLSALAPYPAQSRILDHIMETHFTPARARLGEAAVLLKLQTGEGKTYVAGGLVRALWTRTLYVVTKTVDATKVEEKFREFFPQLRVRRVRQRARQPRGYWDAAAAADVDIAVINTAAAIPPEAMARYNFIIMDEIHNYTGKMGQQLLWWHAPFVLAMSATPDKKHHAFKQLYVWQTGGNPGGAAAFVDGNAIAGVDAGDWRGVYRRINYFGPPEFTRTIYAAGADCYSAGMTIKQFADDAARNRLVVDEVLRLFREGRFTIVFFEHRSHVRTVFDLLAAEVAKNADDANGADDAKIVAGELMGGATAAQIHAAYERASVILTTYSFSSEGISIPRLDAMVLATPRRNGHAQVFGRIFRRGGDPAIVRKIVDIVDMKTPLKSQLSTRKLEYRARGLACAETVDVVAPGGAPAEAEEPLSVPGFDPWGADSEG